MHKKRIILLIFSLISLFLFIYFYKFNMEINLTKENIDFINQDKGLNLIFKMPNMFDIYVRIITESSMKILIFIAPLIVTIPSLKNFYNIYKSGMIKTIVNTRKKYDTLTHGDTEFIDTFNSDVFGFIRYTDSQKILVLINRSDRDITLDMNLDENTLEEIEINYSTKKYLERFYKEYDKFNINLQSKSCRIFNLINLD